MGKETKLFMVNETDGALLRSMRQDATHKQYKNSIIDWTLSRAWTNPKLEPWNYGRGVITLRYSHDRAHMVMVNLGPVICGEFQVREMRNEYKEKGGEGE